MKESNIAIFGGAFNPPTMAHLNLAKQVLTKIKNIRKVIFVPVSTKYNKSGLASDEDRFNMLKCICRNEKRLEVSSMELDSTRQLYTIETLKKFKKIYPRDNIYFILGTDNLKELTTWHEAELILQEFKIIVLERDNDIMEDIIENDNILTKYKNSFIKLEQIERIKLSSSYIRKQVKSGISIDKLVPQDIEENVKNIYK